MDHLPDDRPWPNDGNLDHQVIEGLGLEPGQHGHLGPGLDLEHAECVGTADHRVGLRVLGRDGGQRQVAPVVGAQQVQAAPDRTQHAQCQDIDLHQPKRIDIVLVPLDDGPVLHGRIFHRHERGQRMLRDHETTRMLGQMPRKADQLRGQHQHPVQRRVLRIESGFGKPLWRRHVVAPAATASGQRVDMLGWQAKGLAHVPNRAGEMVGAGHCRQGRPLAPVAIEDVLDHLLAPLVLEVHVDIRRLVALLGNESLEQHAHSGRVQLSDAQCKAHGRVGSRSPALAQDGPTSGEADDVMDRQEVALVLQVLDQSEFRLELRQGLVRDPVRPAPVRAFER